MNDKAAAFVRRFRVGENTVIMTHPGISWGFKASKAVVRHLSPFFKNGGRINKTVWRMVRWNGCQN
jgi:hypothetical protein